MIRTIDEKSKDSWLQRSVAVGQSLSRPDAVSNLAARAFSGNAPVGWNPYEVWLRRVHQPRLHPANGERSPDFVVNPASASVAAADAG